MQSLNDLIKDIRSLSETLQDKADYWDSILYKIEKEYNKIKKGAWIDEKWAGDILIDGKKYFIKKRDHIALAEWTDSGWLLIFGILFGTDDPIMVWSYKEIQNGKL